MTDTAAGPDTTDERLLITGATGMIGRLLVDALLERGARVEVMLRPSSDAGRFENRPGVRVVRGDFDDAESLDRALQGVDRAFLLTNSSERTERQQLQFVEAAARADLRHLVKLSQLHANAESPVRFLRYHAAVEAAIERHGLAHTFVRPNLVMQAYLAFAGSISNGLLQAPVGDARVSIVDARDIAAVAAVALREPGHEGAAYDVTGPASVTHAEMAAAFGRAIGREVRFESVPEEAFLAAIEGTGMPPWQAEGLGEDYAHYRRGEAEAVSPDVKRVTGRAPRSIDDFAQEHADAFGQG